MANRHSLIIAFAALMMGLSACTVQPLYGERSGDVKSKTVSVAEVDSRVAQQVRNRLLFLLNGSGAQAANAEYEAKLIVTRQVEGILSVRNSDGSDISARRVRVNGTLTITDSGTGDTLKSYERTKFASYDTSTQVFANSRSLLEAENRAARELAEEFRTLIVSFTAAQ